MGFCGIDVAHSHESPHLLWESKETRIIFFFHSKDHLLFPFHRCSRSAGRVFHLLSVILWSYHSLRKLTAEDDDGGGDGDDPTTSSCCCCCWYFLLLLQGWTHGRTFSIVRDSDESWSCDRVLLQLRSGFWNNNKKISCEEAAAATAAQFGQTLQI